jgi:hypothetical protein
MNIPQFHPRGLVRNRALAVLALIGALHTAIAAAPLPLVLDMVFYNPGEPRQATQFADPAFVKAAGFNGKVFYLFDSAHLVVNWDDVNTNIFPAGSASRAWVDTNATRIHDLYGAAKAEGLDVYCMSDLLLFPTSLINLYGMGSTYGNINNANTEYYLRVLLNKMFTQFPELDGIVVRIGETYLQDAPYHSGRIDSPTSTSTIVPLMNILRDEVCVNLNKKLVFRTWYSFDVNTNTFLAVSGAVAPHTNLIWSIKHCEGDFHRGSPFSKVLGMGQHKFIVEVQCSREYEGKGAHPHYVPNGVIEGFEEHLASMPTNSIRSIRDLYNNSPLLYGIWTWSRGGGWEGPYIKSELWADLNTWVMAQWALDPAQSEESIFYRYATNRLQLPPAQAANLRQLALLSAEAVYRGNRSTSNHLDPWWTRDQYFRFPPLPSNAAQKQLVLDDQTAAVTMWNQMISLADGLTPPDAGAAETLRSSTRYGQTLYRMFRAVMNLQALTTAGDASQIKSWLAEYDSCWTNYAALAQQYSNTLATYYVEPSQRTTVGTDPVVALAQFRAVAGTVGLKGISEYFDTGFPGTAGQNGWSDVWAYGGITTPVITNTSPVSGGGNYLTFTQTSTGDSFLRRSYFGRLASTNDHVIRCRMRADALTGFTSINDYLTVTDGPSSAGGSSSGSSFIIRAYGASPGGTMPALKWALYNGGKNAGSYNAANWVDSGMAIAAGQTYAFTIVLHPVSLTWDVTVSNGLTSVTTTNLGFRDNDFAIPDTLILNARIGNATNILIASIDTITVSPRPVPRPELTNVTLNGGQFGFSFSGEPGESYLVERAAGLVPLLSWSPVQTIIGTNGAMAVTVLVTNDVGIFRVRLQ